MFRTILAFCGYVKIPKEAVRLAMVIKHDALLMHRKSPDNEHIQKIHEAAGALGEFLRSGRLLS